MQRTKKILAAVALVSATVAPAFAIPLAFDFSGTVQSRTLFDGAAGSTISETSWIGQSFTAQLVLNTERYTYTASAELPSFRQLFITPNYEPGASWTGSLTIGGNTINLQPYANNYGYLDIQDSKGPISCGDGCTTAVGDSLSVVGRSQLDSFDGPLGVSELSMLAYEPADLTLPGGPAYVSLESPFVVDSLLTMALPNLQLSYANTNWDCQPNGPCYVSSSDRTVFDVTSVTTTDLSAASVPEPTTLGLLGVGLFAARLSRRKRTVA